MKLKITLKNGQQITLHKFAKGFIMTDVPNGFNKQSEEYLSLKRGLEEILIK